MKIQSLAIIAIIIILPMAILLTEYTQNQMKTIKTQSQYDSKLSNATYDAIKAFQQNMSNSSTAHLADSKMRDIKGSINIFYDSLGSNLNMSGYGKEVLQNYVPAIVYTLYDGYYIYSAFNNTLDIVREDSDTDNDKAQRDTFDENASYKDGVEIYGLRPYVYYSCRYVKEDNIDVVITYSLDSFITIQGKIGDKSVNESGYLLTGVDYDETNKGYTYNGIEIKTENTLEQNVYIENDNTGIDVDLIKIDGDIAGSIKNYPCKKINGVKYYKESNNQIISIINDKKYPQVQLSEGVDFKKNSLGVQFYKDAYEFKQKFLSSDGEFKDLLELKVKDAVDLDNNFNLRKKYENESNSEKYIFKELQKGNDNDIEDAKSNFNEHRLQVIRDSIETNLVTAISNYNNISTSNVNFQMPKLNDQEWEQITENVSMITFLQGLNIGGKVYNGHSIVSNKINEEFVSDDSIYIKYDTESEYHRVTEKGLYDKTFSNPVAILNVDLEQRRAIAETGSESNRKTKYVYYYPRTEYASYNFNSNNNAEATNTREYIKELAQSNKYNAKLLANLYYTALGREKYGMYRPSNKLEKVNELLNTNVLINIYDLKKEKF